MEIERSITVNLTPNEVKDIIIKHLFKNENIHIDNVSFQTETKYYGYNDRHGTVEFSGAKCDGKLTNDTD
jgi:hypothetical protein